MKSGLSGALLAGVMFANTVTAQVVAQAPTVAAQKEASIWVARALDRLRYKPEGQPDGVGAHPFDRFVESLDPEHMVFTQADLAAMTQQRNQLDRLTDERQMEIPNKVFALYLERSITLHAHALEVLRQPLDFNGHERFERVRSKTIREADEPTLRGLWRRRVMDDYLNLRLVGSPEAQIISTLQDRYGRNLQRVQAMRSGDVANLFLNAYVVYLDPHGAYIGPAKADPDSKPVDMAGTGMVLQKKEDLVTVLEIVPSGPADRSGDIGVGDRIVGLAQGNGQPMKNVIGWTVDEVVELLRGMPGSSVALEILPQGSARGTTPRRVVLTRAKVELNDQRARGRIELIQRGAGTHRIGVIAVSTFYRDFAAHKAGVKDYISVTRDVAAALEQMKTQKADAILLDMRNNGGGSLQEAVDLTGLFLPGVPVVQQVTNERKVTVETTPRRAAAWDGPLAILIDRRSAAATEITAAALQDYGRGLVLGDISYGRGSVQTILDMNRFSKDPSKQFGEIKLTVAVLCRATGKPIQRAGVVPDIVVPGRIDVTGKANADVFAGAACKTPDIPKNADLNALLPTLVKLHDGRMQANRSYQAQLIRRAQEEALLSSDEITLNEAERRRMPDAVPDGDIAKLQLTEALWGLSDAVDHMGKPSRLEAGKP